MSYRITTVNEYTYLVMQPVPPNVPNEWVLLWGVVSEWKWIATTLIALYAATISTYREVMARREKKVQIKARLNTTMVLMRDVDSVNCFSITFENHGFVKITFDNPMGFGIKVKRTDRRYMLTRPLNPIQFPHSLEHGQSLMVFGAKDAFMREAVNDSHEAQIEIAGYGYDAIGREFVSQWVTFTLRES